MVDRATVVVEQATPADAGRARGPGLVGADADAVGLQVQGRQGDEGLAPGAYTAPGVLQGGVARDPTVPALLLKLLPLSCRSLPAMRTPWALLLMAPPLCTVILPTGPPAP